MPEPTPSPGKPQRLETHSRPTLVYYRVGVSGYFFVMGFIFATWAGRIPDIQTALGLNAAQLGGVLFAAPLGQLTSISISAWLIERCGSRAVVLPAMSLYALFLLSLGLAPSGRLLFAALFCFGFSGNMLNISVNSQAVGLEALFKRSIMAAFHGMWSLGGLAGAVTGAVLAPLGVSPALQFTVVLLLALLAAAALRHWTLPHSPHNSTTTQKSKASFRPDLFLVLLGLIAFGSMATEGAMYDWSSVYFAQVVRPGEELIRLGYVACMTAMVLGRFTADWLVSAHGPARVLQLSGTCIALGLSLALLAPQLIPATVGLALVGYGMASVVPISYSLAGTSRKVPTSVAISLVSSVSFLGFLLCPPVVGFLAQAFDLRWALAPIVVAGAGIALLAPLLRKLQG